VSVVITSTSRALPLVSVTVSFRVGAIHDPPERAGLARFVARMLRRGCQGLSSDEMEERVDALGGELSTHVGLTASSVHVELLKRSLEPFVELLVRVLTQPTFDEHQIAKLKRQTEAEIVDSRDNDGFLASRALRRQLFAGHPHRARVAGSIDTVRQIDVADVRRFHQQHYVRDNAVISVAGDLADDEARSLGEQLSTRLAAGSATEYPLVEPQPPQGRNLVLVDKPERTQSQMVIGGLGTHPRDEDHIALLVANTAFGGTFTSRLVQEVRSKRGWSYVASSHLGCARVRDSFTMWTAPSSGDAAACLELQLELFSRWRQEGITAEELSFCQDYLRRSYAFEIDTAKKRAGQKLERVLLDLPDDYHDSFVQRVAAVSLQQANGAVKTRLNDRQLWVAVVGTASQIDTGLKAAMGELNEALVVPYDLE